MFVTPFVPILESGTSVTLVFGISKKRALMVCRKCGFSLVLTLIRLGVLKIVFSGEKEGRGGVVNLTPLYISRTAYLILL